MAFCLLLPFLISIVNKSRDRMRMKRLSKHYVIKAMPSVTFSKKLFKDLFTASECIICLEEFKEGEDYVTPLACDARHVFHSNCI